LAGKYSIIKSVRAFLWHIVPKKDWMQIKLLAWKHGIWRGAVQDSHELARDYNSFFKKHSKKELESKIKDLKKGLDEESIATIDTFYQNCLMIAKKRRGRARYQHSEMVDSRTAIKDMEEVNKTYKRPNGISCWFGDQFFVFHYGLSFVPEGIRKEAARGKDVLDCGAFNGGSTLMFRHFYKPARIFSFEPENQISDCSWKRLKGMVLTM
jgi:hypothetical protein